MIIWNRPLAITLQLQFKLICYRIKLVCKSTQKNHFLCQAAKITE